MFQMFKVGLLNEQAAFAGQSDDTDSQLVTILKCWWQIFDLGDIFKMLVLDAKIQLKRIFMT